MTYLDPLADRIRELAATETSPPADAALLFRAYALLARTKGENVTLRDVHDAWVLWMQERGETHESMIPFEDLPPEVQAEDAPFMRAIQEATRRQEH